MSILGTYREPFGFMPSVRYFPEGETLLQMRRRMDDLPEDFDDRGIICINGHQAPRALWGMITPKPHIVTEITFHAPPMGGAVGGGGQDTGKMIVGLVAAVALTVVTGGIAGGWLAVGAEGSLFAAGSTSALLLAGAVSLAGGLLLSALAPPPSIDMADRQESQDITNPGAASAEGNLLRPNGAIPRVIGERKVYPPLAGEPRTFFEGPDEVVEAVYILAGPHRLNDIRIGSAPIDDISGVEYETREGWQGIPPLSMGLVQSRTEVVQTELRGYLTDADNSKQLDTSNSIQSALPQEFIVSTREDPDEHQLQLIFPQGLHKNASDTNRLRVPFRLRLRPSGTTTWTELPEFHFQAANLRQMRTTIRLVWADSADIPNSPASGGVEGWAETRIASPAQPASPSQPDWNADPYFVGSGSDDWMDRNNLGTTKVRNVLTDRYTATIYLDKATFTAERYEAEIIRGAAFDASSYNASTYEYGGTIWDFWGYQGSPPEMAMARDGVMDTVYFLRSVSMWNEPVLAARDCAVIAVRARNRELQKVSTVAGGYVRDWDGAGWNTWTVTDNPAPHLRDIYVGAENLDPVPLDLIDDTGLVAFRSRCISQGYTCNALVQDMTLAEVARIVAACGYARPYTADVWGVTTDHDRSAEDVVAVFTPRNSSGFSWTKAFARIPEGLRVNFRDKSRNYEMHQVSVFRDGYSNDSGRMEQITYEGIVTEADAIARAEYDQAQAVGRNVFYSFTAPASQIMVRRGDLIGVQHNSLSEWSASARIESIEYDGSGNVTALVLDSGVPLASDKTLDELTNMSDEENLADYSGPSGVLIRRGKSSSVEPVAAGSTPGRLVFSPAIDPTGIIEGGIVSVGRMGEESLRLIVFDIQPRADLEATITCVDEAPQLWS